jgi:hypothetical protein
LRETIIQDQISWERKNERSIFLEVENKKAKAFD